MLRELIQRIQRLLGPIESVDYVWVLASGRERSGLVEELATLTDGELRGWLVDRRGATTSETWLNMR